MFEPHYTSRLIEIGENDVLPRERGRTLAALEVVVKDVNRGEFDMTAEERSAT